MNCYSSKSCTKNGGECIYYSSTFLSGVNIQNGDDFNVVVKKIYVYINAAPAANVDATNLGSSGARVYAQKNANIFEFRRLVAGTNISLSEASNAITINASSSGESNTASNVGLGSQLFKQKAGVDLQFRSLITDATINKVQNTNDVTLNVVNDTNTQRVKVAKAGALIATREQINFIEGTNVSLTMSDDVGNNRTNIVINSTGGGGGGGFLDGTID